MKGEVLGVVNEFFDEHSSLKHANASFISLILKFKGVLRIQDLCPIPWVNTIYKVITKLLATRLFHVVPNLLSPNQSAFTKGKIIRDNIILA